MTTPASLRGSLAARIIFLTTITVSAVLFGTSASAVVVPLPKYNVSIDDVSVSGFSSGADMTSQMHFAYSKTIKKGIDAIAGAPYYCSQGNVTISVTACMLNTAPRNIPYLQSVVSTWSGNGYIDPTSNMAAHPRSICYRARWIRLSVSP